MRTIPFLTLLFVAAWAGACSSDTTPVGPSFGSDPSDTSTEGGLGSAASRTVPFKAHHDATRVGIGPGLGCDARRFFEGNGTGAHLGVFTIALSFCGRGNGTLDNGTGTLVGPNGDLLEITFHGVSDRGSPVLHFTSYVTFTGGTGRFRNATGIATVDGIIDSRTNSGPADWNGTITFASKDIDELTDAP